MTDKAWVDPDGTLHSVGELFFLGVAEPVVFDPGAHPELSYPRMGWAFACPHCAQIWDRISLYDHNHNIQPFEIVKVACSKHHDFWNVPGSVLAAGEGLLPLLPPALLRREFDVHLSFAEKQLGEQDGRTKGAVAANGG